MAKQTDKKTLSLKQLQDYASKFGLNFYKDLLDTEFVKKRIHKIKYEVAKEKGVLPLFEDDGSIYLATSEPNSIDIIQEVSFLLKAPIIEVISSRDSIMTAIEKCYSQNENETGTFLKNIEEEKGDALLFPNEDEYDLLGQKESSKVIKILNMILLEALGQNASDIHFDPTENGLNVRYRIDGVMHLRHRPPKNIQQQLITRIKVIAKLDIAEHRLPQDGRIKLKKGGKEIDFRVSSIPVAFGERIVLRILDKGNVCLGLSDIGMEDNLLKSFRSFIKQNQGIVLVTGPTGSGKTTTLYSAISDICSPNINIMTIEDPVEYKLPQIAQIGVNHKIGLSFAKGLRSILRQDPDVILIGEIRDRETAEIAIQASLTGHLVVSTLHTNDAPSAITRLIDMGIEPYLISSSVLAVLGQRLVRKICPHCKVEYIPTVEEKHELDIHSDKIALYKGKGCDQCFNLGYQGREAIYELLEVGSEIKKQLLNNPDASALQELAVSLNMKTMREYGKERALTGHTTASEVLRVTRKIATTKKGDG
ncbi:MAG: ATPase, T2SS/T4P/T4SS family [Rhabdochlamydiaceae bacterium]|nr:ATPase, T2SS/T4P/T4SS family [Candidatus Amphrikana amoebophyrae]